MALLYAWYFTRWFDLLSKVPILKTKCRINWRKWRVRELLPSTSFLSSSLSCARWLPMHRARSLQGPSIFLVVIPGAEVLCYPLRVFKFISIRHESARCKANPPGSHLEPLHSSSVLQCVRTLRSSGKSPSKWGFCCFVESLCSSSKLSLSWIGIQLDSK